MSVPHLRCLVREIVRLRWRHRLGPVQIVGQLGIAPSTVHAVLVRARINRLSLIDRITGEPIRRYEHPHPGALIHVEVTKFGNIPDGGGHRYVGRQQGEPLALEVDRYRREAAAQGLAEEARAIFEEWEDKPERQTPHNIEDWQRLALEIRFDRAAVPLFKVLVGGQAFLTIIERNGGMESSRIFDFNDEGEEWELILARTRNPIALALPCDCGSGRTWGDCCVVDPR